MSESIEARRALFREMADRTRWRAYMLLGSLGERSESSLAQLVGVSPVVMRRHLEVMEGLGLVVSRTGGGRARLWSKVTPRDANAATGLRIDITNPDNAELAASREVSEWMKVVLQTSGEILSEFLDQAGSIDRDWQAATELQDYVLRLRREELTELGAELRQVVQNWRVKADRRRASEPSDEGKPVYVVTHAVVYPRPEST